MELNNVSVATLIIIIMGAEKVLTWIWGYFNKAYKLKKGGEDFHETVTKHDSEISEMQSSQNALTLGVQALLKNNLKQLHKEYMIRGSITSDESDNFTTQYNAYHGLGGNGTGTRYMQDLNKLPIIDD